MALDIIGPGFGRTGTASLKRALELLGLGPCHHMEDCFANPAQVPFWRAAAAGRTVDWEVVFDGFRAQVDWLGAYVWRDLAVRYPAAKVILTVRPEQAWWRSFSNTIGAVLASTADLPALPSHVSDMLAAMEEMVTRKTFGCAPTDADGVLAAYRRHIAEVRATIAPDRLLVYDVAQGWEPLCRFLGVAAPAVPFPHTNRTEAFLRLLQGRLTD